MLRIDHQLLSPSLGVQKTLTSLHFGKPGAGRKVYLQASLHAEELPGMLVAHHLRALLARADATGSVLGEVVLVPVANPLGLAQRLDHKPMGRFDLDTSENFNRHYPDFATLIAPKVLHQLSGDSTANVKLVRQAMGDYLRNWQPASELQSLRRTLLGLAYDADTVLDLHCDCEAVLHLYTEEACWPALAPLAALLECEAVLLAKNSGGGPFDECLSGVWWQLGQMAALAALAETNKPATPLPQSCHAATVELRGEADVTHALAQQDAMAIFEYLKSLGVVRADVANSTLPAPRCQTTPLAGSQTLTSNTAGVLVFAANVGQTMAAGDLVAEVIDPISGTAQPVFAGVAGVFYARVSNRYVTAGAEIGKIAGAIPFRSGPLLGA